MLWLTPSAVTPQFSGNGIGRCSTFISDPVSVNSCVRESVTIPNGPALLQVTSVCSFAVFELPITFARRASCVTLRLATATMATWSSPVARAGDHLPVPGCGSR